VTHNDPYIVDFTDKRPGAWADLAACLGHNPDLWFPPEKSGTAPAAKAKAICATCAVKQECLDYALSIKEQHGIWGGRSLKERQAYQRAMTNSKGPTLT
jgi:WhiB family transcriptional regulator, redox-sensing transcriptional regulator